jgi:hypothetical protein
VTILTNPTVGAIAFSKSGTAYTVTEAGGERVTVLCPDGKLKRVPLSAIARWEMPQPEPEGGLIPAPPIGAIAYGELGIGYTVIAIEGDLFTLQTPDHRTKVVPLDKIYWWEMNPKAEHALTEAVRVTQDLPLGWRFQGAEGYDAEGRWYSSDTISKLLRQTLHRPNRLNSTWLYDPMPEVGDRVVIRNLTQCLKRHPRLSLDLQCAVYQVVRVNDDSTVSVTSDYGDARYPADWVGVLP